MIRVRLCIFAAVLSSVASIWAMRVKNVKKPVEIACVTGMIIGVNEFEPASKSFYQEQMKLTDKRYFGSKLFHHTKDRKRNNATGLKILLAHVNIIYDKDVPIPNFLKKLSTVFIEDFKEKNGCIEFDYTDWDSIEDRHVVLTIEEKALEKFMKLYNLKNIK